MRAVYVYNILHPTDRCFFRYYIYIVGTYWNETGSARTLINITIAFNASHACIDKKGFNQNEIVLEINELYVIEFEYTQNKRSFVAKLSHDE